MSRSIETLTRQLELAITHHEAGRFPEAEQLYRAILQDVPHHPEANHNLGRIALDAGRNAEALLYLKTALQADPTSAQVWLSYVDALIRIGEPVAARKILGEGKRRGLAGVQVTQLEQRIGALESRPQLRIEPVEFEKPSQTLFGRDATSAAVAEPSADEVRTLTGLLEDEQYTQAEGIARQLTFRFPLHPFGWKMLGRSLHGQHMAADALQPLAEASRLAPTDSETHVDLALSLEDCGRLHEAETHLREAERLQPNDADIQNNLGVLLARAGRRDDAEPHLRKAIRLRPAFAEAHSNLGLLLQHTARLHEAETSFLQALRINPGLSGALSNLGGVCQSMGRMSEAETYFRRAVEMEPTALDVRSNLLFSQNYTARQSPEECLQEARRFGEMVDKTVKSRYATWPKTHSPERLRVGFVSGDLRGHPVGYFIEALVAKINVSRLELFAYPTQHHSDALTARIRPRFSAWKPLYGFDDDVAAQIIHDDGIHVLLDLSGHTAQNRLPVFARKPAPVQVSWLGYFATTGVREMDYLLADQNSVPQENQKHFTETIWYLPETRLCFTPPPIELPVAALPALTKGHVTLGSFQNLAKLGDDVLALWSEVMAHLPDASMRLQNEQLGDPHVRQRFADRLQRAGIAAERVSLRGRMPRAQYLAAHEEVDFILDSFPYPGGTTTCEALWMGVPTLTLAGDRLLARQGVSLMAAAGLREWIAKDKAEFVEKAAAFARDIRALGRLRASMRERILRSPLFDASDFARNFEKALWDMWNQERPR